MHCTQPGNGNVRIGFHVTGRSWLWAVSLQWEGSWLRGSPADRVCVRAILREGRVLQRALLSSLRLVFLMEMQKPLEVSVPLSRNGVLVGTVTESCGIGEQSVGCKTAGINKCVGFT